MPGARWLDVFGDEIGDPPAWVSLGHLSPDGAVTMVKTHHRRAAGTPRSYQVPADAMAAELGQSPLEWVAFDAAFQLVNLTLPAQSRPRPPGFLPALVDRAEQARHEYPRWPTVRWSVAGAEVPAHVWWFAGGWAAFTEAVPGLYLTASGVGTDPDGLSLTPLTDGHAYHFDLHQPLATTLLTSSRATALGDRPLPEQADWHPDQLRIIDHLGPP